MASYQGQALPCHLTEYHNRRISSCSTGSSSSYASSEDNVFAHRHMENNNIPKHIDRHYKGSSHENRAYRHEEIIRPSAATSITRHFGTIGGPESSFTRIRSSANRQSADAPAPGGLLQQAELLYGNTRQTGHINHSMDEIRNSRKYENHSPNIHSNRTSPGIRQLHASDAQSDQTSRINIQNQSNSTFPRADIGYRRNERPVTQVNHRQVTSTKEGELMQARPLPLTPENGLGEIGGAPSPLRYQNDSPFISGRSLTGLDSSADGKRSLRHLQQSEVRQKTAEELLKQVPWFQPKMNRDQVLENLSKEELGSFIIRESSTHNTCFALSVKVPKFNNPSGIAHYIIHRTSSQGFRIKGLEKEWTNLSSLVVHHTIVPELLPCTLKVPHIVSSRRQSTVSRGSNSSRGSSGSSSPASSLNSEGRKSSTLNQTDRLSNGLDRTLKISNIAQEPV